MECRVRRGSDDVSPSLPKHLGFERYESSTHFDLLFAADKTEGPEDLSRMAHAADSGRMYQKSDQLRQCLGFGRRLPA